MLQSKRQMAFGNLFFGVALLLLVFTFGYTLTNFSKSAQTAALVAHTYEVQDYIERLSSNVKDAERAERGFLLTSDESYVALFQSAVQDEQANARALSELIRSKPVQQEKMRRLEGLIQQRFAILAQVIEVQKRKGFEAARQMVLTGSGKRMMEAIQFEVKLMQAHENRLLERRLKDRTQANQSVYAVSALLIVLVLLTLAISYWFFYSTVISYRGLFKEKKAYAEQLEQTNQELEMVAAIASHDLKAPLRKIRFFTDEIIKDPASSLSAESRDFFERIQASVEKMQALIENVLAIARRKRALPPPEKVDLRQVAEEVASTLETQILETGGRVEIGGMCAIQGDHSELAQLLQNLIENSLKFHRPGVPPHVSVRAFETGDGACEIRVKDNGCGVEKRRQKEIFEMFSRAPDHDGYAGTGIGLGTVSKIVRHY